MNKSHTLSEKAIKKLGLDKKESYNRENRTVVKEWNSSDDYFQDEFVERFENKKWYQKVGDWFKYSIGWRCRDWYYDTKWYFSNLKRFQPILKTWRSFDYQYQVDLFTFGLQQLADAMEYYGNEIEDHRKKRIDAIHRLIDEINHDYDDEIYEKYKNTAKRVTKYDDGSVCFEYPDDEDAQKNHEKQQAALKKARKEHYAKIFNLIIGKSEEDIYKEVEKRYNALSEEEKNSMSKNEMYYKLYMEIFDGSGIEGWWD